MRSVLITLFVPMLLIGCAAPAKYTWGNYDGSLYSYYKGATKSAAHMAELQSIIDSAEKTQGRVAPGIHAEYGYLLLQQGKSAEAAVQFENEKAKWPESTQLMNTMIRVATAKSDKSLASKE
jgi:hypothetical protein